MFREARMLSRLKSWLYTHRRSVLVACGIACAYLCMFAVGITCPIKYVTGISCPGCGLSRAWFHAVTLDLAGAFAYHPLFWLVPFAVMAFALEKRSRACRIAFYAIVAVAIIVYAVRMLDTSDAIVVFAPENGVIPRLLQSLPSLLGL